MSGTPVEKNVGAETGMSSQSLYPSARRNEISRRRYTTQTDELLNALARGWEKVVPSCEHSCVFTCMLYGVVASCLEEYEVVCCKGMKLNRRLTARRILDLSFEPESCAGVT